MKHYAVIDTNVLVSSMLTSNPDSTIAKIINYVRLGSIIPMFDDTILEEYQAVLSRDRFSFDKTESTN